MKKFKVKIDQSKVKSDKNLLFERMHSIAGMNINENNISHFDEEFIINESPNQAKKYLSDKQMGIDTPKGKEIFDKVTKITRGDGYTLLITKFMVDDRMPEDELEKIHSYVKNNKDVLKNLPKPTVQYDHYRELKRDIDKIEENRTVKKLFNELPSKLKNNYKKSDVRVRQSFVEIAKKYAELDNDIKKQIKSKISSFNEISDFNEYMNNIFISIESGDDIKSTYNKIKETDGAEIVSVKDNKIIANIRNFDASSKLGCTSQWCITRDKNYFRQYKRGGNYYFFIWDFDHPVNDDNFLIGTAYNLNNPSSSATYVKSNRAANILNVLSSKNIPQDTIDSYIEKYKEEARMKLEDSMKDDNFISVVVKSRNGEEDAKNLLVNHVKASEAMTNYPDTDVEVSGRYLYLDLTQDQALELLDINEDDYLYISSEANYPSEEYIDSDEYNYLHNYLNSKNIELIADFAKKIGKQKYTVDKLEEEGEINNFFEEIDDTSFIEDAFNEISSVKQEAKSQAASNLLNELPINIDDASINLDKIIEDVSENNGNYNSFDEYLENNMPSYFSYDAVYENSYEYEDYDDFNNIMESKINDMINDLDDEYSDYFDSAEAAKKATESLTKLGFKLIYEKYDEDFGSEVIAHKIMPDKEIAVVDQDGDKLDIHIKYNDDYHSKNNIRKPKDKKGFINLDNLVNYVNQMQVPYQENKKI